MEHTKEPWAPGFYMGTEFPFNIVAPDGRVLATIKGEQDRRRIVACVNACRDMSTMYLEQCGPLRRNEAGESIAELIQRRDELLAAAIKVNALSIQTDAHRELRAAIAAVKPTPQPSPSTS